MPVLLALFTLSLEGSALNEGSLEVLALFTPSFEGSPEVVVLLAPSALNEGSPEVFTLLARTITTLVENSSPQLL